MKLITSNHVIFSQSIKHGLQSKMEFLKELRLKDESLVVLSILLFIMAFKVCCKILCSWIALVSKGIGLESL